MYRSISCNQQEYYQVSMDFWTQINQKKEVRTVISRHYKLRKLAKVLDEGIKSGDFRDVDTQYASYIML